MFRRNTCPTPLPTTIAPVHRRRQEDPSNASSRELLIMAQNHMLAWLAMMYIILLICRVGFGWTPGRAPPVTVDMVPIPHANVTIVTAFFDIPSKRPSHEYLPWIRRFLTLKDNMVVFTTKDQIPLFQKLRRDLPTKVIGFDSLDDLQVTKDFGGMDYWQRQANLDPEKYLHSKELYVIWNEKGHFLERAMDLNPFQSDFFAWVDMGYLRDDLLENQRMIRYLPKLLTRQQAIFLDVRKLVFGERFLGGGFIGGYQQGLRQWITKYYELLETNRDRFLGKDQPWMFETCIRNMGLCLWVEPRDTYGDPWFYMAPFLHGVSKYGTLDHLRHVWRSSRLHSLIRWLTREHIDLSRLAVGTDS